MRKQFLIPIAILLFLAITTATVSFYGKGYRFSFIEGKPQLSGTGLLVTNSTPNGAQVFLNGHLTTATDNTINLFPGEYQVRIVKEGYFPWEKKIKVTQEEVSKVDALLFPSAPQLVSITTTGIENPTIDPSLTRIAYTIASQSARKNGVYVLDMSTRPILTLQSAATQLADETTDKLSKAFLTWSPDGQELIASTAGTKALYLLQANGFNSTPPDITATLTSVQTEWEKLRIEKEKARLTTLTPVLQKLLSDHFKIISWSPDETKILYQATSSATLPIIISPRLIGANSTPEDRNIRENTIYVYDSKEDRNYRLDVDPSLRDSNNHHPIHWFPNSTHLIYVHDKRIDAMEYDSMNATTVYAGPFVDSLAFTWPSGSKIVILTNLGNSNITPNLYTVDLK